MGDHSGVLCACDYTRSRADTGPLSPIVRPPVSVYCILLTDGGAMCQSGSAWYKLSPDASGSYLNGSWSTLASLPSGYNPDAFASAVLADGRVVIVGGECVKAASP